jgi:hypothetical protein
VLQQHAARSSLLGSLGEVLEVRGGGGWLGLFASVWSVGKGPLQAAALVLAQL